MRLTIVLAAVVLAVAAPAFAQETVSPDVRDAMQAMHKACEADIKSLCADAQSSGDRRAVGRCLRQNADKLGPDCKAAMEKLRSLRHPQQPQQQPQQ